MNKQMFEVMHRRSELLARIAVQREQIAGIGMRWQVPLEVADKGLAAVRFLRSNPILLAGMIAFIAIRRRGLAGMVMNGWRIWRLYKSAASFSARMASHLRH